MMQSASTHPMRQQADGSTDDGGVIVPQKKEEEVANFLLLLKNRSPTPEPQQAPSLVHSLSEDSSSRCSSHHYHHPPPHHAHPPTRQQQLHPETKGPYHSYHYPAPYGYQQHLDRPHYVDQPQNLHHHHQPPHVPMTNTSTPPPTTSSLSSCTDNVAWENLLSNSPLVFLKDRDLVPDSLFVAMAQMKPCSLTMADRVGCYKSRELGFIGMCCKHCGGQPGFGRYYPNSVRSLAQTTTSQTILKHIGSKCRFCPPHVRNAVQDLMRQQAAREGSGNTGRGSASTEGSSSPSSSRPRYGSRKIFFQRVWSRLHGDGSGAGPSNRNVSGGVIGPTKNSNISKDHHDDDDSTKNTVPDDISHQTPSDLDEESSSLGTAGSSELHDHHHHHLELSVKTNYKRKSRFGALPMTGKRVKVTSPHHRLTAD